jgi:23S rRNA pseudouridine1911/1915/1917 synthase
MEQMDDWTKPEEVIEEEADIDAEEQEPLVYEKYRFKADPGQALRRVDKFLVERIQQVSRTRIQTAADAGFVLVNGHPVKSNYKVKPLDEVLVLVAYPPRETEIIPEAISLNVVYEDEDVLVVNKPPGMVVHPGHGNFTGTLANGLAWYFRQTGAFQPDDIRPGLVHRIDKDTSGLLVVAKNPSAKANLSWQFFNKTTERQYVALVWGRFDEMEGTVEGHIGRHPRERQMMTVFPDGSQGKPAVTHYKVLESFDYVTLISCRLETGRTHQIRAHMKYLGHPVFNDVRYGGAEILRGTTHAKYLQFVRNCFAICPRHALHAKTLGFKHPVTGEWLRFDSAIPSDMQEVIDRWRHYIASRTT